MPRPSTSLSEKKQAAKRKFGNDGINVDATGKVICTVCTEEITFTSSHGSDTISNHLESNRHKRMKENGKKQPLILNSIQAAKEKSNDREKFIFNLTKAFTAANIPLYKINHPILKMFLETEMKRSIPDRSTLEKYHVDKVYEASIKTVKAIIGDHPVYFIVDETQDIQGRFVLNILVGKLDGFYSKPMLLRTRFLQATNAAAVSQEIILACTFLWSGTIRYVLKI